MNLEEARRGLEADPDNYGYALALIRALENRGLEITEADLEAYGRALLSSGIKLLGWEWIRQRVWRKRLQEYRTQNSNKLRLRSVERKRNGERVYQGKGKSYIKPAEIEEVTGIPMDLLEEAFPPTTGHLEVSARRLYLQVPPPDLCQLARLHILKDKIDARNRARFSQERRCNKR